jgi:hypothetical protein
MFLHKSHPECLLEIHPCLIYKKLFQVDRTPNIALVKIPKIQTITKLLIVNKFKEITVKQKEKDHPLLHLVHHLWINHFKKWNKK